MTPVRVIFWILGITILSSVVGACFVLPERVTRWRVQQLLEDAAEAADTESWADAARLAKAAHQLQLANLDAIRLARDALRELNDPEALRFAELAAHAAVATERERVTLVEWLLQLGYVEQAGRWIDRLERGTSETGYLKALHAAYSDDRDGAIQTLKEEPKPSPRHRLLLGELLLRSDLKSARIEGTNVLLQLLGVPGETQRKTLHLLSRVSIPPEAFSQMPPLEDVLSDSQILADDFLALQNLEICRDPSSRSHRVQYAIEQLETVDLDALVGWLTYQYETEFVLQLLNETNALDTLPRYEAYLSALLRTNQLDAAVTWLESPIEGFPEVQSLAVRATIARVHGDSEQSRLLWQKAVYIADKDSTGETARILSTLSLNAGEPEFSLQALRMVMHRPVANFLTAKQFSQAIPFFYERSHERDLLAIAKLARAKQPDNPDAINNFAYLRILEGVSLEDAIADLEELVSQYPSKKTYKASLALGYLQIKRPDRAADVIQGLEVDWQNLTAGDRAVLAATSMQTGKTALAREIAASLAEATLLPNERTLIESIR